MHWCSKCNKDVEPTKTVYFKTRDVVQVECHEYRCPVCHKYLCTLGGFYD